MLASGYSRRFIAVRLSLGLLLVVAAVSKVLDRTWEPFPGLISVPSLARSAFIVMEICIGLWLMIGFSPRALRTAAALFFACLAASSLVLALSGEQSCGCFGKMRVSPWFSFVIAFAAILALLTQTLKTPTCSSSVKPFDRKSASRWEPSLALAGYVCAGAILVSGIAVKLLVHPPADLFAGVAVWPQTYDFGESTQDDHLKHSFTLANNLPYPIQIKGISANCECATALDVEGVVVDSGASLQLPTEFKTGNALGRRKSTLTLYFGRQGEWAKAWKQYHVQTSVKADFVISPTVLELKDIGGRPLAVGTIRIQPGLNRELRVTDIECSSRYLSAQVGSRDSPTRDLHVDIALDTRELESFSFSESVRLHLNSHRRPFVDVTVHWRDREVVTATPAAIVVGSGERGLIERKVTLSSCSPFVLALVKCSDARVTCSIDATRSHEKTLLVQLADSDYFQPLDACIQVWLAKPDSSGTSMQRLINIPVHRLASPHGGKT